MSNPELEWVQLNKEIAKMRGETFQEKLIRKVKENPYVPIGCLATAGVLSYGLYSFRRGQVKTSQNMMRLRVVCQGLTVAAMLVGVVMNLSKK